MATSQAKIGRKRMSKREIKITVPFRSYMTCDRKLKKKQQKKLKNSKISMWLHEKPKQVLKGRERQKIKIILSFRFYRMRNKKLHKNCKKTQKIKKYHYGDISSQNRQEKSEKETKTKLSFLFVPTRRVIENSEKI